MAKASKEKITITAKQEKLASVVVEHAARKDKISPLTKGQLVELAGYAPSSVQDPQRAFNSKGFLAALAKRGFNMEKAAKVMEEGLEANIVTVYRGEANNTDAPDYKTRHSYLSLMGDFLGMKTQNHRVESVNVNMTASEFKDII